MRIVIPVMIALSLILIVLTGCSNSHNCPKIGDKAPDFTLPSLEGKNVSLSSLAGKTVIINTWSISCIECKKEMPYFQDVYDRYKDKGLILISVNTMDSVSDTKAFLNNNKYDFPVLFDYKKEIYNKFCCPKTADPNTFIIDSSGTIKTIKIGSFNNKEELEGLVKSLF